MRFKAIQILVVSVALIGTLTRCIHGDTPSAAPSVQSTDPVKSATIPYPSRRGMKMLNRSHGYLMVPLAP